MVSAAILTGGRATRFGGRDKGALAVGGRTIQARQLSVLEAIADDILLVGGPDRRPASGRVRHVADARPNGGPLAGIESALTAARHDLVAIVACDMPGLTAPLVAHLVAQASEADVVVPRTESGYHPLCAIYRRTCLPAVSRRLAAGQLAVKGLFEDVRVREVPGSELVAFGDPARLLANVNTPADHGELDALLTHEL